MMLEHEISSLQSSNRCAHLRESNRTLRDGSFGVGFSQALRARLRSHRPSGTFQTRFSSGREENLKMERDFAAKHGKINGLHPALNLEAPFFPGLKPWAGGWPASMKNLQQVRRPALPLRLRAELSPTIELKSR